MTTDVVLCECFARDGLQHEPIQIQTDVKVSLIDSFTQLGFKRIEATSFTHPVNVPQFFDSNEVLQKIKRKSETNYKATCVNLTSVNRAIAAKENGYGPSEISVILSASNAMLKKAFNRDSQDQLKVIKQMIAAADNRFHIIGTISFVFGSPFEGAIANQQVIQLAKWLYANGVTQIAIGDTMGFGTPRSIGQLFGELKNALPQVDFIAHFHDTRGLGVANCMAAYDVGVRYFDCAFGGVGGNPAKISYNGGFTGNVCTEDLATMFEMMGISTGLDMSRLLDVALSCEQALGRQLYGRVTRSGLGMLDLPRQ